MNATSTAPTIASKYAAAIIAITIDLAAALGQLTGTITVTTALQLAALAVASFGIYYVPLLGRYRAAGKVAVAVSGAVLAAGIPLAIAGQITGPQIALVVLAGLKALGAAVGVAARTDSDATAEA